MENIMEEKLEALQKSIDKWKNIVDNGGEDNGALNCPLCEMCAGLLCDGCPIKKKTGATGCWGTPYSMWRKHFTTEHPRVVPPYRLVCDECEKLAQQELTFLENLYKDLVSRNRAYLKIENPDTPIGYDEIKVIAVDGNGDRIKRGNIIHIDKLGVVRCRDINPDIGFDLDNGKIKIR